VATDRLRAALGPEAAREDLPALLQRLFATDDANFDQRHRIFYERLAPLLRLYLIGVGDVITIKAPAKSGYFNSVNVKVYGFIQFRGIEKSGIAGMMSVLDLLSFRDLYGYLTKEKLDELKNIQRASGTKAVTRENAEAELFGGDDSTLEAETTAQVIDTDKQFSGEGRRMKMEDLLTRVYTQSEIDDGVVLNASILMKDPSKARETLAQIDKLSEAKNLGIKTVTWQQAAGILGNLILVFRFVLFAAVAVIFFLASLVITSSLLMAMLQRTQMIGTLRAIGAHRSFVLSMVFHETLVLGTLFGGGGLAVGALIASVATKKAWNDATHFIFSGPVLRLHPSAANIIVAGVLVIIVSMLSTLIPALIATRVSPLRAMQSDE
jgi:ABC-type antimicrobial peptide transport system permease subunit